MAVAYSMDLRERVARAYAAGEGTQQQIAQRFQVSPSFVQRLLRRQRESGRVAAKPRGGNHLPKIRGEHLAVVKQLVATQPDAFLEELVEEFKQQTGVEVSITTMHRTLNRLHLSMKKKHYMQLNKTVSGCVPCVTSIADG